MTGTDERKRDVLALMTATIYAGDVSGGFGANWQEALALAKKIWDEVTWQVEHEDVH